MLERCTAVTYKALLWVRRLGQGSLNPTPRLANQLAAPPAAVTHRCEEEAAGCSLEMEPTHGAVRAGLGPEEALGVQLAGGSPLDQVDPPPR